jgi:ketosteroid isomerase-like protein
MTSHPLERAREWIAAWNRRDVEAVLAHYRDDATFRSPKATAILGDGQVVGKSALRAYWMRALERYAEIRFTLDSVMWDPASGALGVVYEAALGGNRVRATEIMHLDADGRVIRGEAFYGAPLA